MTQTKELEVGEIVEKPITRTSDGFTTNTPEATNDFASKIISGILKLVRKYVPTYTNSEDKKVHHDVAIIDGVLYVGSDKSPCIIKVGIKAENLCMKKMKDMKEILSGFPITTVVNYGTVNPWLKLHSKKIQKAYVNQDGIKLVVVPGFVELDLGITQAHIDYAEAVDNTIATRVLEENLVFSGRVEQMPELDSEMVVLCITKEGKVKFTDRVTKGFDGILQLRVASKILPVESMDISVYDDPLGNRIVRIFSEDTTMWCDMLFRVLPV